MDQMQIPQAKAWLESTIGLLKNEEDAINDTYYVQSGKRGPISQKILQATMNGVHRGKQRELEEHNPQNHRTQYNREIHGSDDSEADEEENQEHFNEQPESPTTDAQMHQTTTAAQPDGTDQTGTEEHDGQTHEDQPTGPALQNPENVDDAEYVSCNENEDGADCDAGEFDSDGDAGMGQKKK